MKTWQKSAQLTLSILMGVSPIQMMAQQPSGPMSQLSGLQGTLGIQAGNYNFTSYDKGKLQEFVLHQMANAQEADKQFILAKTAEIEIAVNSLIKDTINGTDGIQKVADTAYTSGGNLDLATLLTASRAYMIARETTLNKLASIKALPSAMKKDESVSLEGSGVVALRTSGVVDLSEIITFYKSQIDKVDSVVQNVKFTVVMPNKKPLVNVTLRAILDDIAKIPPYSPEKIREMQRELNDKRNIPTAMETRLNAHFLKSKELLMEYVTDFGTLQKWRANTTPEERKRILTELEEVFWSRSLLRATYGIPLGAMGIQFNTQKLNAEYVFANNEINFLSTAIKNQGQINSQRRTLLIALSVMEKRDENILAAETPFLSRILSGLTIIKGEWQLADVNVQILKLLYADMAEEGVLATQGYNGMRAHYQTRYYTGRSAEEVAAIRARAKDWKATDQAASQQTARGTFALAMTEGEQFLTQLHEVEQLRAQVEAFTNTSEVMKKYKQQADEL